MTADRNSYAAFWDRSYRTHYAKGARFRRPQDAETPSLQEFLAWDRLPPPPAALLDAGCGDGLNAVFLASRGYAVTGVDASAVSIRRAREHAGQKGADVRLVVGDVRDMSEFPDGSFALAIDNKTFHSLWTYEDRAGYLGELHRALRPNAAVFFRQNCAPAELRDEFGWREFLGRPIGPAVAPEDSDAPPNGPGIWPNSLGKYQEQLRRAGFTIAKAGFYKGDPEPVSVIWCLRE